MRVMVEKRNNDEKDQEQCRAWMEGHGTYNGKQNLGGFFPRQKDQNLINFH